MRETKFLQADRRAGRQAGGEPTEKLPKHPSYPKQPLQSETPFFAESLSPPPPHGTNGQRRGRTTAAPGAGRRATSPRSAPPRASGSTTAPPRRAGTRGGSRGRPRRRRTAPALPAPTLSHAPCAGCEPMPTSPGDCSIRRARCARKWDGWPGVREKSGGGKGCFLVR